MQIEVLYQDDDFIIVNKPSGLLVHPYKSETNERTHLMKYVKEQTGLYLYPINRIDRPVSGIVVFGLSSEIVRMMKDVWNTDSVRKEYITLARGIIEEPGEFTFKLKDDNGVQKEALTKYWPMETFKDVSLMRVEIGSGRKHQIRRHFSRRCQNLIGDTKYGKGYINREFRERYDMHRIFLHSHKLEFTHPKTGEKLSIHCPLPPVLANVVSQMQSDRK